MKSKNHSALGAKTPLLISVLPGNTGVIKLVEADPKVISSLFTKIRHLAIEVDVVDVALVTYLAYVSLIMHIVINNAINVNISIIYLLLNTYPPPII